MISGLVLKYLNGECFVICGFYKYTLLASTEFNLTVPYCVSKVGASITIKSNVYGTKKGLDCLSGTKSDGGFTIKTVRSFASARRMPTTFGR